MDSTADLKDIYLNTTGDLQESYKTSKTDAAAELLDAAADAVGATAQNPAIIPLFRYVFSDTPTPEAVTKSQEDVLALYNSLTPKVKFVYKHNET